MWVLWNVTRIVHKLIEMCSRFTAMTCTHSYAVQKVRVRPWQCYNVWCAYSNFEDLCLMCLMVCVNVLRVSMRWDMCMKSMAWRRCRCGWWYGAYWREFESDGVLPEHGRREMIEVEGCEGYFDGNFDGSCAWSAERVVELCWSVAYMTGVEELGAKGAIASV